MQPGMESSLVQLYTFQSPLVQLVVESSLVQLYTSPVSIGAASGGVLPGSTLHLPVSIGAASGGVLPGSALHLPVSIGAARDGVLPGSALHLPVSIGAASGGVLPGSALSPHSYRCRRSPPWFSLTPASLHWCSQGLSPPWFSLKSPLISLQAESSLVQPYTCQYPSVWLVVENYPLQLYTSWSTLNKPVAEFSLPNNDQHLDKPGIIYYVYWKQLRIVAKHVKQSSLCHVPK